MWTTLSRHAKAQVEIYQKKAGETPKAELRVPLQWEKPVKTGEISGYMLSERGDFSVSKDSVRGAPMYTAWDRRVTPPAMAKHLGVRLDLKDAQRLCDLENQR